MQSISSSREAPRRKTALRGRRRPAFPNEGPGLRPRHGRRWKKDPPTAEGQGAISTGSFVRSLSGGLVATTPRLGRRAADRKRIHGVRPRSGRRPIAEMRSMDGSFGLSLSAVAWPSSRMARRVAASPQALSATKARGAVCQNAPNAFCHHGFVRRRSAKGALHGLRRHEPYCRERPFFIAEIESRHGRRLFPAANRKPERAAGDRRTGFAP